MGRRGTPASHSSAVPPYLGSVRHRHVRLGTPTAFPTLALSEEHSALSVTGRSARDFHSRQRGYATHSPIPALYASGQVFSRSHSSGVNIPFEPSNARRAVASPMHNASAMAMYVVPDRRSSKPVRPALNKRPSRPRRGPLLPQRDSNPSPLSRRLHDGPQPPQAYTTGDSRGIVARSAGNTGPRAPTRPGQ